MAAIFSPIDLDAAGPSGTRGIPDDQLPAQVSSIEVYGADEETLIRLLRTKMKYALAEAGYDSDAQHIVSELVERNVISCGIALGDHEPVSGNLFETASIQSQLRNLMAGGFNVNSNEPVLMILADSSNECPWDSVVAMRDASCAVLRDAFHVYPVRVYVARHPENAIRRNRLRNGFSLALLNVVNTDIGGPGMIQLLDDRVTSSDWEQMIVSAEAWNRTELQWRSETRTASEDHREEPQQNQPALTLDHTQHTIEDVVAHEHPADVPAMMENAPIVEESSANQSSEANVRDTTSQDIPVIADHPAWTELMVQEAARPTIQHPSWAHSSGGHSLLDLISMQASTVEEPDAEADPVEDAAEAEP